MLKKRTTCRVLIILGIALVVCFAVWQVFRWSRGEFRLEACKKELRARGEKLTLPELNPQKPPVEGNGAPVLLKAMEKLDVLKEKCPLTSARSSPGWQSVTPV